MKRTPLLNEARRLYRMGFAIHWLHPKSKRPIESGWTTGPRKEWAYLEETYFEGLNLGVRLGTPSKIRGAYLCVIDVDVKSDDKRHRAEAWAAVRELVGDLELPLVSSGRGNGSGHLYCVTSEPFKTWNPAHSSEIVKVRMPSKQPSKKELQELTQKEIDQGIRLSRAWEVSLYSDGRQVVLPPSVHPDTGKPYQWTRALNDTKELPLIEFPEAPSEPAKGASTSAGARKHGTGEFEFKVEKVDLELLPVSDKIKDAIVHGEGVEDRSAYLLPAATALVSAGLTQNQVLTVLTEPETFLGACGYDHAKTTDRARAAYWVWKYTLARVQDERNASKVFKDVPVEVSRRLEGEELEKQNEEMDEILDWRRKLERAPNTYKVKNTLKNIKLIMSETFGKDCVRTNEFAMTEELWGKFPWVARAGKEAYDIDVTMIRDWFAKSWGFEPSEEKIRAAVSVIGFENRYHPVRQWLRSLPRWDEQDRIDELLSRYMPCEGDDELRAVIGRRFMVALVKRIFEPGCQSDYVLILEGLQGINKSSAFRALVGDDWFSDASFNVEDKDAVMVIFSKWLIEFGELSTLDRTTAEHTKAFITRRMDRIRAPFDRKARDYPRQCLFVGSTNKDEYLKDDSGNRRYWPFKVIAPCDVEALRRDREQLFAEALWYYEAGEATYLHEEHLKEKMLRQQEPREMHDVLHEQVAHVIESLEKTSGKELDGFPIKVLFDTNKLAGVRMDPYGTARVGTALRKLGYAQRRPGGRKDRRRLWFKRGKEVDSDDVGDFFGHDEDDGEGEGREYANGRAKSSTNTNGVEHDFH